MNNMEPRNAVLSCSSLCKTFSDGTLFVPVLHEINLTVHAGEMVSIIGPSGSGKSTLLHILSGLDKPTSGTAQVCGIEITTLSEIAKGELRNQYLGFVYQFHHLLPEFTALENVCVPLLLRRRTSPREVVEMAKELLGKFGLEKRLQHRMGELSGGERQRVAIARALVTNPKCVLADEPTGNLDHKTAENIYQLILRLNQEYKTAFVIVSHDLSITKLMHRTLTLCDGVLAE